VYLFIPPSLNSSHLLGNLVDQAADWLVTFHPTLSIPSHSSSIVVRLGLAADVSYGVGKPSVDSAQPHIVSGDHFVGSGSVHPAKVTTRFRDVDSQFLDVAGTPKIGQVVLGMIF